MEIAPYHFMIAKNMRAKRCKAAREPECFQERESAKRGAFRSLISVAAKHMRRGAPGKPRSGGGAEFCQCAAAREFLMRSKGCVIPAISIL